MRVNPKKSSCIRFGARFSVKCSNTPPCAQSDVVTVVFFLLFLYFFAFLFAFLLCLYLFCTSCATLIVIISTVDNCKLSWSDNVRYLGIYLRSSRTFACSFSHAKQSMYHAFNAVFGKVWRTASPDVVLQLVQSKCLPALCYSVDVCPVNKSQTASLQYVVDNASAKYLMLNQQRLCDFV